MGGAVSSRPVQSEMMMDSVRSKRPGGQKNDSKRQAPVSARRHSYQRKASVGDQSEVLLLLAKPKFAYLDADGSGYLGLVQLEEVMESILEAYTPLGKELSEANRADIVRKAVALIDTDSKLDVYQFCNLFNEVSTRVVLMSQSEEKFKALDSDGSGFLEKGELLALAHSLLETGCGFSPTERGQIRQRLEERLNTLNDGPLDLYEFSLLFEHCSNKIRLMSDSKAMFLELDKYQRGYLEREELGVLAERLLRMHTYHACDGSAVTAKDRAQMVDRILRMFDSNHEGRIDLYKFSSLFDNLNEQMTMIARARTKFAELDLDGNGVLEAKELATLVDWVLKVFEEVSAADHSKEKIAIGAKKALDDGSKLDFAQFIKMFTDVSNRVTAMQRAKAKFEELDTDQSGYLETAEISEMVDWMLLFYSKEGEPLTFAEKDAMKIDILALVDSDRDGKLSLAEFTVIFQQVENKKVDARRRKSLFVF